MKMLRLSEIQASKANFLLENFLPIPENAVTLLSAKGGTGKTRLSLIMADRYINEKNKNVALWLTEDYPGQVRYICDEMIKANIIKEKSLSSMIIVIEEPPQLAKREQGIFKANYEEIKKIGETMISNGVGLAVFDPLLAFYGGNENDNSEARVFIQTFAEWAKTSKVTTIIIHHANKDGNSRGATAFHDGVRCRYEMSYIEDGDGNVCEKSKKNGIRAVSLKKDNWGVSIPLHRLTDGQDTLGIKIAPPIGSFMREPEINTIDDPMIGF